MTCAEANEILPLHVAGEVRDEGYDAHREACEPCSRRAELHQRAWALAGLAAEEEVPPALIAAVEAKVRRRRLAPWLGAASVAAAAVLAWLALAPRREGAAPQLCAPEEGAWDEDQALLARLKSIRITLDVQNAPLSAILEIIGDRSGLTVRFAEPGDTESEMISFNGADVTVEEVLRRILVPRQWTYRARSGAILVERRRG